MAGLLSGCGRCSWIDGCEEAEPDRPGAEGDEQQAREDGKAPGERGKTVEQSCCSGDEHDRDQRQRQGKAEDRSEEHTSELQSLMRNPYAVLCLKKQTQTTHTKNSNNRENTQ